MKSGLEDHCPRPCDARRCGWRSRVENVPALSDGRAEQFQSLLPLPVHPIERPWGGSIHGKWSLDQVRDHDPMRTGLSRSQRCRVANQGVKPSPVLSRHRYPYRLTRPLAGQTGIERTQAPFLIGLPSPPAPILLHSDLPETVSQRDRSFHFVGDNKTHVRVCQERPNPGLTDSKPGRSTHAGDGGFKSSRGVSPTYLDRSSGADSL